MGKEATYDKAVSDIEAYIGLTEIMMLLQCCVLCLTMSDMCRILLCFYCE